MAMPKINRPAMRKAGELARPIVSEPAVKMTLEMKMMFLRPVDEGQRLASIFDIRVKRLKIFDQISIPSRSAALPETSENSQAPRIVTVTMADC